MSCREFQDWLHRRLDGEMLPLAAELEQHVADCGLCRPQQQAIPLLLDAFQRLSPPSVPERLTSAIVARVLTDRRARTQRWRRRVAITTALAASLLLAALAGYLWLPGSPTPEVAKMPEQHRPPVLATHAAPSLSKSVEEAGSAVAALTEKIADKSKEQARVWWSAASLDVAQALPAVKLEQPLTGETLRHAGQGMSEGLQTVAQSARKALSYFARELPPLDGTRSGG